MKKTLNNLKNILIAYITLLFLSFLVSGLIINPVVKKQIANPLLFIFVFIIFFFISKSYSFSMYIRQLSKKIIIDENQNIIARISEIFKLFIKDIPRILITRFLKISKFIFYIISAGILISFSISFYYISRNIIN